MSFLKRRSKGAKHKVSAFTGSLWDDVRSEKKGFLDKITVKKELIRPGVNWRESIALDKIQDYVKKETGKDCTVPQHVLDDIYSMYVNEDFKRVGKKKNNMVKQTIIDKMYNSFTKDITKNSSLFSQIVTRELALVLQEIQEDLDKLEEEQEKEQGKGKGKGTGQGQDSGDSKGDGGGQADGQAEDGEESANANGDGGTDAGKGPSNGRREDSDPNAKSDSQQKAENLMNKQETAIDDAMNSASNKMKELEDALGKEALKDLSDNEPDFLDKIDNVKDVLKRISINKNSIRDVLVKILDKSTNYFSRKFHTVEESIFDAEELEDVFGLEFLHPVFKNAELMNIGNATRKYTGKIDLYLDCSGSMSSSKNFAGHSISMIDVAKGIAMTLYRMGMIRKLYFFDTSLYEIKTINEYTILAFNRSGGTDFDKVIESVIINKTNSVIVTDGHDSCAEYTNLAFWIGVGGTIFNRDDAFETFRAKEQCVTYDHNSSQGIFKFCK